jgi:hypothetical protein
MPEPPKAPKQERQKGGKSQGGGAPKQPTKTGSDTTPAPSQKQWDPSLIMEGAAQIAEGARMVQKGVPAGLLELIIPIGIAAGVVYFGRMLE